MFTAKPTTATPFHVRDGVTLWVSETDLSPDDDFLSDAASVAWQPTGASQDSPAAEGHH